MDPTRVELGRMILKLPIISVSAALSRILTTPFHMSQQYQYSRNPFHPYIETTRNKLVRSSLPRCDTLTENNLYSVSSLPAPKASEVNIFSSCGSIRFALPLVISTLAGKLNELVKPRNSDVCPNDESCSVYITAAYGTNHRGV